MSLAYIVPVRGSYLDYDGPGNLVQDGFGAGDDMEFTLTGQAPAALVWHDPFDEDAASIEVRTAEIVTVLPPRVATLVEASGFSVKFNRN